MTIAVNPLSDLVVQDAENTIVDLINNFDDPLTTGLIARFELYNPALGGGVTDVVLFDQPGAGAPLTVQNFRNYVQAGAYTNSIIHRSVPGFIVQGGGFTANGLSAVLAQTPSSGAAAVHAIPAQPAVLNEFSPQRSNLRGTIAMAKVGGDPNSATNQWFFNLANNSANLDTQNGGFTVFGQVRSATDLASIDAIAAVPRFNDNANFFGQGAVFNSLPLQFPNPTQPVFTGDENFVRYRSITIAQVNELQFTVVNNSNPDWVTATINNNQLLLSYHAAPVQTAMITIRATNLLGESVEDTFLVNPPNPSVPTGGTDTLQGTSFSDVIQGLGGNDQLFGFAGDDRLLGQAGADRLIGGEGGDVLLGGAGNDVMNGEAGNDRLEGGIGSDKITTGAGRDIVVIGAKEGFDRVIDFVDRRDKIQLSGRLSFGQLAFHQQGNDTLIQVGKTNLLRLENVNVHAIDRRDFVS